MFKRRTNPEDVTPTDAAELQRSGVLLLDVREDDEWCSGHAPDATHLPLSEVADAAARFEGCQVLTVCRSGGRSAQAAKALAGREWMYATSPVACRRGPMPASPWFATTARRAPWSDPKELDGHRHD